LYGLSATQNGENGDLQHWGTTFVLLEAQGISKTPHRHGHLGILPNGALRTKEVEAQPAILQVVFLKYMVQIGSK